MENQPQKQLPLAEMKALVEDLFKPNPWIYWADFLFSITMAWGLFIAVEQQPELNLTQYLAFMVSGLFFYRAVLFIHELTHRQRSDLPGFSLVWNLLIGIPVLFPSFMYRGVHTDHHKKMTYGTKEDGEYLPFGTGAPWKILFYVAQSFYLPLLNVVRFAIITPISFLHPKLRRFVMEQFSSLAINFSPKRSIPTSRLELRNWYMQEFLCFFYLVVLAILFFKGILHAATLRHVYLLIVLLILMNAIRTLAAHRYNNADGSMSFTDQLLDSVNIESHAFLTEWWAPLGLRFHGLHHLFPTAPYHSLGKIHRRFMAQLPKDALYRQTVEPSIFVALKKLWDHAKAASNKQVNSNMSSELIP